MPLQYKCQIGIVRHATKPRALACRGWPSTAWVLKSLPMNRLECMAQVQGSGYRVLDARNIPAAIELFEHKKADRLSKDSPYRLRHCHQ